MGKGGTRFVGDAVSVRGKSKGYTSRDQKKASTHVHPPARACLLPAPKFPGCRTSSVAALPSLMPGSQFACSLVVAGHGEVSGHRGAPRGGAGAGRAAGGRAAAAGAQVGWLAHTAATVCAVVESPCFAFLGLVPRRLRTPGGSKLGAPAASVDSGSVAWQSTGVLEAAASCLTPAPVHAPAPLPQHPAAPRVHGHLCEWTGPR